MYGVNLIDRHLDLVSVKICHVRLGEKSGGAVRKQNVFTGRNTCTFLLKRNRLQHLVDITGEFLKFCEDIRVISVALHIGREGSVVASVFSISKNLVGRIAVDEIEIFRITDREKGSAVRLDIKSLCPGLPGSDVIEGSVICACGNLAFSGPGIRQRQLKFFKIKKNIVVSSREVVQVNRPSGMLPEELSSDVAAALVASPAVRQAASSVSETSFRI